MTANGHLWARFIFLHMLIEHEPQLCYNSEENTDGACADQYLTNIFSEENFAMEEFEQMNSGLSRFAEETLLDSFMKIARVNLLTGEYKFLKMEEVLQDEGYSDIPSIYEYIRKQVTDKLVLSEYAEDYLKFSDPAYVQARVFSGERRVVQSYTRKAGDHYMWATFAIIAPENCTPENPWAIFTWREADTDTITMVDALSTLSAIYYKIVKANLTRDTFECVKVDNEELKTYINRFKKVSDWWGDFAESGNIYEEDREVFRQFMDLDQLRLYFKEEKTRLSCRYRRKINGEFRWVQVDFVPSIEYREDSQVLIMYMKDVHEEHLLELQAREELVDNYNRDALTMLYNRHKFNEDLEELRKSDHSSLTCLYVDVNGLHELNNKLGHEKGDNMLCSVADALRKYFPEERLYRIGGDEFVMLSTGLSRHSVEHLATEVRVDLQKDNYEISVGVESGALDSTVYKIVGAAELAMRTDKERYYKQNGDRRKNRAINEELEKMLLEKQDAETFLKVIATKFAGVYFVNMKLDTLRHIYIPNYFLQLLEKTDFSYSKALRLYAEKFVKEEHQELFFRVLDYDRLAEELKRDEVVQFSYQKVDGTWMNLRILSTEEEEKQETVWIFLDENKDLYKMDARA